MDAAQPPAEASALAVRVVPRGARVALVSEAADPATARMLEALDCTVRQLAFADLHAGGGALANDGHAGNVVAMSQAPGFAGEDAILLLDLHRAPHPPAVLASVAGTMAGDGLVIVTVANPGYATARAAALAPRMARDEADASLDLPGWEHALADAGLAITDTLRVTCDMGTVRAQLQGLSAPLVGAILELPDAAAHAYVLRAVRRSAAAADRPDGSGLYEQLQRALADAERRAAVLAQQLADGEAQVAELRATLTERMRELEEVHEQRRHIELDNVVKDAFIADLRAKVQQMDAEMAAQRENESLRAEIDYLRDQTAQLDMTRYRMADAAHRQLRRIPLLHQALRTLAQRTRRRPARRA